MNYLRGISGKIKFGEPLKGHTTFRIGGKAKVWFEPESVEDLTNMVRAAGKQKLPLFVIGSGSNVLIADKEINGVFIKLSSAYFKKMSIKSATIYCGAGATLAELINTAYFHGLSGLEFLSGIPGTLGGAVFMNAGISAKISAEGGSASGGKNGKTKTKSIGDFVKNVTVMDYKGNVKKINSDKIIFTYRKSNLERCIILSAHLKLLKKDKKKIKKNMLEYINKRRKAQDYAASSAGCFFKNPSNELSAGRLIDLCGLKGRSVGGAAVSRKHANFIVNKGGAKAGDVLSLMSLIRKRVKNKFGLTLNPEVKIWQ